jgi:hypothetical protein
MIDLKTIVFSSSNTLKLLLIFCLSLISLVSFSQEKDSISSKNELRPFSDVVETTATYEKGNKNLKKELKAQVTFDKSVSGSIYVGFTVDSTGRAFEFKCLKGIAVDVDQAVINALEKLQKWSPARNQGRSINCKSVLKIEIEKGKIKTKR